MSGGSCFNSVHFDDVRIPDDLRLGEVGAGWRIALTTLGLERTGTVSRAIGGQSSRCSPSRGGPGEPVTRSCGSGWPSCTSSRASPSWSGSARRSSMQPEKRPDPPARSSSSAGRADLTATSDVVAQLLGATPRRRHRRVGHLHVECPRARRTRLPHRVGGSDEIQRNIVGEHVLGLPAEPRVDFPT